MSGCRLPTFFADQKETFIRFCPKSNINHRNYHRKRRQPDNDDETREREKYDGDDDDGDEAKDEDNDDDDDDDDDDDSDDDDDNDDDDDEVESQKMAEFLRLRATIDQRQRNSRTNKRSTCRGEKEKKRELQKMKKGATQMAKSKGGKEVGQQSKLGVKERGSWEVLGGATE